MLCIFYIVKRLIIKQQFSQYCINKVHKYTFQKISVLCIIFYLLKKMAGNEWQPQDVGLQQILQLLRESQSHDNNIQRSVQQVSFPIFHPFSQIRP